jgi:hypothetical protein
MRVPALADADRSWVHARLQKGGREREVRRPGDLEVVHAALHQARRQTQGLDGTGFVGHGRPGGFQRPLQQRQPEHLRRLGCPLARAVDRGRHAAVRGLLQRVGQRQGQQAAHGVVGTGIEQTLHHRRAKQAAGGVVNEHPVVVDRAACPQGHQAGANSGRPGGAARVR